MFYLHMSFMALMCIFVLLAAMTAKKRAENWLPRHRVFAIIGVLFGLTGIFFMFYAKAEHGWHHFSSPHAIGGGIAAILLLCTPTLGYLSLKGKDSLKPVHKLFGRITTGLALLVLLTGVVKLLEHLGIIKD